MSDRSDTLHKSSEKWAAKLFKLADKGKQTQDDQDPIEALEEGVYGQSSTVVMRLTLSGGGPADWLEVELSKGHGWEVESVTHCSNDWFEEAKRTNCEEGSGLYRLAEHFAGYFEVE